MHYHVDRLTLFDLVQLLYLVSQRFTDLDARWLLEHGQILT